MSQPVGELRIAQRTAEFPVAEQAYAAARKAIIECQLRPGARFSEAELSTLLGLGRTPVREALGRLRQEGLVDAYPRAGYRVTPLTLRDVREIFGVRSMIEGHVAAVLASRPRTEKEISCLRESDHGHYVIDTPADQENFIKSNTAFHLGLANLAGNRRVTASLEQVLNEMERLVRLGWAHSPHLNQHAGLIDAICSGDASLARQVAEESVARSMENTISSILESPDVQSIVL